MRRSVFCFLVYGLLAVPAMAQVADTSAAESVRAPRLEIGAQAGLELLIGAFLLGGGGRLTVNLTPRDALDVVADPSAGFEDAGVNGVYFVQYKRMLRERMRRRNRCLRSHRWAVPFVTSEVPNVATSGPTARPSSIHRTPCSPCTNQSWWEAGSVSSICSGGTWLPERRCRDLSSPAAWACGRRRV